MLLPISFGRVARLAVVVFAAAASTWALFLAMKILITDTGRVVADAPPAPLIDFIRLARNEDTQSKTRKPPRPPRPQADTPPPAIPPEKITPQQAAPIAHAVPLALPDLSGLFVGAPVDGDALALVRVLPHYPARALARGIEGWVVLAFNINALGQPIAPRVIESQPQGVFDAAALAAVKRWKYRPMIQDGKAVSRALVRQRIRFQIDK